MEHGDSGSRNLKDERLAEACVSREKIVVWDVSELLFIKRPGPALDILNLVCSKKIFRTVELKKEWRQRGWVHRRWGETCWDFGFYTEWRGSDYLVGGGHWAKERPYQFVWNRSPLASMLRMKSRRKEWRGKTSIRNSSGDIYDIWSRMATTTTFRQD